ncbi:putative colanic acid biosynthesis acetyltransferase WcaF [Yoonia tamlensis]|uniref:Putative colanic acid biosynthesis acetyltransferase WcaF n=1 Tax=Yoonia tamlensis TaxID=390270 RepID=A0A1I6GQU6_9RHOB|nr:acetyltransferase [Yoonia tamlensis]SFR44550.1 putative colanic acid biosynthesis acetyltransferase WcaF [Yoonia tamlensis]
MTPVDVNANRRAQKYARPTQIRRVLWAVVWPLFRLSPRIFWPWRVLLLRGFGARIGRNVHIYPNVRITMPWHLHIGDQAAIGDRANLYALGEIHIGARATISQGAHLCAGSHDWRDPARPLITPAIWIDQDAWVCADAFVGPAVRIGARAILGARAVAMRDLPADHIGVGNPLEIRPAP